MENENITVNENNKVKFWFNNMFIELGQNLESQEQYAHKMITILFWEKDLATYTFSDPNLIVNALLQSTSIFTPVLKSDDNLFQVLTRSSKPSSDDIRWYLTISDTFSTKKLLNRTNWSSKYNSYFKIAHPTLKAVHWMRLRKINLVSAIC